MFSDPLSEDARAIRIDKDFAKILYTKWRKTVQVSFLRVRLNFVVKSQRLYYTVMVVFEKDSCNKFYITVFSE